MVADCASGKETLDLCTYVTGPLTSLAETEKTAENVGSLIVEVTAYAVLLTVAVIVYELPLKTSATV
jgi:hypothetical protein